MRRLTSGVVPTSCRSGQAPVASGLKRFRYTHAPAGSVLTESRRRSSASVPPAWHRPAAVLDRDREIVGGEVLFSCARRSISGSCAPAQRTWRFSTQTSRRRPRPAGRQPRSRPAASASARAPELDRGGRCRRLRHVRAALTSPDAASAAFAEALLKRLLIFQRPQVDQQILGGLIALLRILLQRLRDDAFELGGDVGPMRQRHGSRVRIADAIAAGLESSNGRRPVTIS